MNTNQDTTLTNQDAFEKWWRIKNSITSPSWLKQDAYEAWQAATQASESEINSLKERVAELEADLELLKPHPKCDMGCMLACNTEGNAIRELQADNIIMRDTLNKIALGHVYDADIIESAGDCLQRLSNSQSLAEQATSAHRQREADIAFLNKEGRKLPAVCQQKAVATVINLLKEQELVDGACVKVATAVVMHGTAAISWQARDMGLPDGVHDLYAGVRK